MKYTLVADVRFGSFINKVNEMIAKGWEPLGGVSVYNNDFVQAMVLKDDT